MKTSNIFKKLSAGALAIAFVFASSPLIFSSYAQASRPSIKEVRGRQAYEVKLDLKYEKYAGDKVRIKLYRENLATGEETVTTHNRKLDDEGKVTLRVDELEPGTLYEFKAKIKKQSGGDYSDKSKGREGSTKLLGQMGHHNQW